MKLLMPMILVLSTILFGCNAVQNVESNAKATEKKTDKSTEVKKRAKSLSDIYVPNPQVSDDRNLLNVGQTIQDSKGTENLKGIASLNKSFTIGPIEMKIKNVKLIHNLPEYSLMDYFHYYTENYKEFDYIKVEVELVNHSDQLVHFGPIAHLQTSNGETRNFEDDFYIEYLGGEIEPNDSKQGALGFIVEKSTPDLNWVEIQTSDVLDKNHKEIGKSQKIKINF
jgi:NAD+--asparagine ADP-ribosyltransferase